MNKWPFMDTGVKMGTKKVLEQWSSQIMNEWSFMDHRRLVFHGSWKHGLLWILERKSGLSRILEEWSSFMDTGRAVFHGRYHHILYSSCLNKIHQAQESRQVQAATLINSST